MAKTSLNIGEWGELYAFLRLVGTAKIDIADEHANPNSWMSIRAAVRNDNQGKVVYSIKPSSTEYSMVDISVNGNGVKEVSQKVFEELADSMHEHVSSHARGNPPVTEYFANTLAELEIQSYKAKSSDKNDVYITLADPRSGQLRKEVGYSIKTAGGQPSTLFNTGTGSRSIYRINGIVSDEMAEYVNSVCDKRGHADVSGRIQFLKSRGCSLQFERYSYCTRAACRAFEESLDLINPRLIDLWSSVVAAHFEQGVFGKDSCYGNTMNDVVNWLVDNNPCKIAMHLREKYEYMIKTFLYAAYCGLTASAVWNGKSDVNGGLITVDGNGELLAYNALDGEVFKSYLFNHCVLDYPSTDQKHGNYGSVFKDGCVYYLALNFQIRFAS